MDGTALKVNDVGITEWNFNYEMKKKYKLSIQVTDNGGLSSEHSIEVLLSNVNDVPSLNTPDLVTSVGIQPDVGTVVLQMTATDEDLVHSNGEVLTLSITSGNDDAAWMIVAPVAGGNLLGSQQTYWNLAVKSPLANNLKLSGHTWNLICTVTDSYGATANQNVQIIVQGRLLHEAVCLFFLLTDVFLCYFSPCFAQTATLDQV
jgi:hypothetical protein